LSVFSVWPIGWVREHAAFAEFALRPVHYRLMAALEEHGDLSQVALGRHLGLDRKDVAVAPFSG